MPLAMLEVIGSGYLQSEMPKLEGVLIFAAIVVLIMVGGKNLSLMITGEPRKRERQAGEADWHSACP